MNIVDPKQFEAMLNLLKKIIDNIINNPSNDKFRAIRKSNKVLNQKLFIHSNVSLALQEIGFVYDNSDEVFVYFEEDVSML